MSFSVPLPPFFARIYLLLLVWPKNDANKQGHRGAVQLGKWIYDANSHLEGDCYAKGGRRFPHFKVFIHHIK